jgi:pyruvate formate lyase activating enzyme
MTVEKVIDEVMKDKAFYDNSGGGITVSGGEPMMQFGFTKALLEAAKKNSLHTCLDTCGYTKFENFRQIMPYVDIFLYDLKETDSAKHKKYTGVPLEKIMENLKKLDSAGAKIILRCPISPGLNDREEHLIKIADTAGSLKNIICINIQPYHPLGVAKNARIGKDSLHKDINFASDKLIGAYLETIQKHTFVKVEKG